MSTTAMPRDWTLNIVKFIGFTLLVTAIVAAVMGIIVEKPAVYAVIALVVGLFSFFIFVG